MGNKISVVFPQVTRAAKNYNFENRARRMIEKEKLPAAPRHPSTVKKIEEFCQEHPELYDEQKSKNVELNERLKGLYLDSKGVNPELTTRQLPQSRTTTDDTEFGFADVENVPEGKVTLKQTLSFIVQHNKDPSVYTAEKIAEQYNLDTENVKNILNHFQTFQMHLPEEYIKKKGKKGVIDEKEPVIYRLTSDKSKSEESSNNKSEETDGQTKTVQKEGSGG